MSGSKLDPTWGYPGTLLVLSWITCGSEMGPPSTHHGTILVPSRIPPGSSKGQTWTQLGTILVPSLINYGSLMGPSWTHLGTLWFPRGSLRDHRRVKLGPNLEPARFLFDPSWILGGSTLNQFGTVCSLAGPSGTIARSKCGPSLELGPFGTLVVPLGSILEP